MNQKKTRTGSRLALGRHESRYDGWQPRRQADYTELLRLNLRKNSTHSSLGHISWSAVLLSCLRFDALVSDIALPDGSGLELAVEAKKRQRFIKAVALTGLGQPEDRERGLRAGLDEYLTTDRPSSAMRCARLEL